MKVKIEARELAAYMALYEAVKAWIPIWESMKCNGYAGGELQAIQDAYNKVMP